MSRLFLFALFAFATQGLALRRSSNCVHELGFYKEVLRLQFGVDVTTLDMLPLNKSNQDTSRYWSPQPVLEFNCHPGTVICAKKDDNGECEIEQTFPNEVETMVPSRTYTNIESVTQMSSIQAFRDFLQEPIGVGSESPGFFALCERNRMAQTVMLAKDRSLMAIYDKMHYYQILLHQPQNLTKSLSRPFKQAIATLADTYVKTHSTLFDWSPEVQHLLKWLFDRFGTHYFTRAHYGVYTILMAAIDDEYFFAQNAFALLNRTASKMDALMSHKPEPVIDPLFNSHASFLYEKLGNSRHHRIIQAIFRSISDLLPPGSIQRQLVETAIKQKIIAAYLTELIYSLEMLQQSSSAWFLFGAFNPQPLIDELLQHSAALSTGKLTLMDESAIGLAANQARELVRFVELVKCSSVPQCSLPE